jgi:hypothetical protein
MDEFLEILQDCGVAIFKVGGWFAGNAVFGLTGLLVLYYLRALPIENFDASPEIKKMLNEGIVLFFAFSLMGGIVVDLLVSEAISKLNIKSGFRILIRTFAIIIPFVFFGLLCINYSLILSGGLNKDYFNSLGWFPRIVIFYSFGYCFVYKFISFTDPNN